MKTIRTILKILATVATILIICLVALRISSQHSPSVDIFGSYFPAWMVCIVSGLTLTLIANWIVQVCRLRPYFGAAPLTDSCLMIIFTFATWILFYQN